MQCCSLVEVRAWLKEQRINVRDNLRIGELLSRHLLLAGNFCASEIAAYICDPVFHPPGTSFHVQMLPGLLARTWDFRSWHAIRNAFCKAAELGLISVKDLRTVIDQVADAGPVSLVKDDGKVQIVKSIEKEHFIHGLLTAVANSRVLTLADLGRGFLSRLLRKVGQVRRFTTTTQRILWDLSPWASESDATLISRLTIMHLRAQCRNGPDEEVGEKLAERLARVGSNALQLAVLQTTHNLIRIAQEDTKSIYIYLFHHWTGTLAILGSKARALSLAKDIWGIHSSSTSSLSAEQRLLAFAWTWLGLGKPRRTSPALPERVQFLECFDKTLKSILDLFEDGFLKRAIIAVESLPLPNKHVLLQNLSRLADREPFPVVPDSSPKSDMDRFQRQGFSLFLDRDLYQSARLHHTDVLTELAESLNQDLPLFKMLSRRMIKKNPLSFDIISRILENNIQFKLALSQTLPQRLRAVSQQPKLSEAALVSTNLGISGSVNPQQSADSPSPEEALDLMNHLAVSFATSPVTSPRASLRRVYWCYTFLHRYGGPVQPTLTRALWHVGVTRYGDSGTARTLLKWILYQIKRTEGEHVARHLLWSQALREQWRRDLEGLAQVDANEETRLLAELTTAYADADADAGGGGGVGGDIIPSGTSASADLETLRNIRFARTESGERPFFFEKSIRRADWDRVQARRAEKAREQQTGQESSLGAR